MKLTRQAVTYNRLELTDDELVNLTVELGALTGSSDEAYDIYLACMDIVSSIGLEAEYRSKLEARSAAGK
ncbi:MAG: hypothetical protein GY906_23095 [bacterium]|nr:hypothetical protein [bacterium]